MTLKERVEGDLAKLPRDLADSALAGTALAMAERIDAGRGSPSECAKALMQALQELRALAPPKMERDAIDDLGDDLARRRRRRSATSD